MTQYVALLRGINVGGNNKIKMADLKACFEKHGFANVTTYIQSGNVLFEATAKDRRALTIQIEDMLAKTFSYEARVVLRSHDELTDIVEGAPKGFGTEPAKYRSYVLFLKDSLSAAETLQAIPLREGVDQAWAGPAGVIFHQRVEAKATQSYLNRLVAMPIYQEMTIRNWNTTTKLLALMEAPKT
jgi:uncharacterized protein (DUF1697 family)